MKTFNFCEGWIADQLKDVQGSDVGLPFTGKEEVRGIDSLTRYQHNYWWIYL